MLLIISEDKDYCTDEVISWLILNKEPFIRYNSSNEYVKQIDFKISNRITDVKIKKRITKVWHRRGRLKLLPPANFTSDSVFFYLKKEVDSVIKSIELFLKKDVEYIGSFIKEIENYKLTQLEYAKECGLIIPDTLITTSKESLIKFLSGFEKCITKDIRYPVSINVNNEKFISTGVKVVTKKMIDKLDSFFAPIYVQKCIEKKYEIRLFFIKSKFYPMAIFSQSNKKTEIDFRNYDDNKQNRCVPVKVPQNVLLKIKKFINKMDINTGSIDLIYSSSNEYVFLEVNPQGQFGWLSKNCNYYIEKYIAKSLKT